MSFSCTRCPLTPNSPNSCEISSSYRSSSTEVSVLCGDELVVGSIGTVLGLLALHSPCLGAKCLKFIAFCNDFIA